MGSINIAPHRILIHNLDGLARYKTAFFFFFFFFGGGGVLLLSFFTPHNYKDWTVSVSSRGYVCFCQILNLVTGP